MRLFNSVKAFAIPTLWCACIAYIRAEIFLLHLRIQGFRRLLARITICLRLCSPNPSAKPAA